MAKAAAAAAATAAAARVQAQGQSSTWEHLQSRAHLQAQAAFPQAMHALQARWRRRRDPLVAEGQTQQQGQKQGHQKHR